MKNTFFSFFFLFLLFSAPYFPGALELEVLGGVNFMTFDPDRKTAYSGDEEFKAVFFPVGKIAVSGDLSGSMSFNVTAARDNILLNSLSFSLYNRTDNFRFEFGPFIGMGDDLEVPNIGITGSIEITFPGIAFLSFGGSSSMGLGFDFTSVNSRESAEVKLGLWFPNVIPSVSVNTRSLTTQPQENLALRDTLTRFEISADLFIKNIPVIIRLDAGYEIYTRAYKRGNAESIDELNAWFAGIDAGWQVIKPLRITAGFEIPVFYSATGPMAAPDSLWNIFKATAGIVYTFF
jgi:hypothetical protein